MSSALNKKFCKYIFKKGKNKGLLCQKNCKNGDELCAIHKPKLVDIQSFYNNQKKFDKLLYNCNSSCKDINNLIYSFLPFKHRKQEKKTTIIQHFRKQSKTIIKNFIFGVMIMLFIFT